MCDVDDPAALLAFADYGDDPESDLATILVMEEFHEVRWPAPFPWGIPLVAGV